MIEIKLEEASSLTMEMMIEGDLKDAKPQLRLSVLAEGLRYSFTGEQTTAGTYKIDFPAMLGKITEGEYPAEVEIMVDGKYFVPLEDTVSFTKEIKPTIKLSETVKVDAQKIAVKMGSVKKAKALREVSDARSLIGVITEGEEIDTGFALRALNGLALNEAIVIGDIKIAPKRALTESEAVAALTIIGQHGNDLESREPVWEGLKALSEKTSDQLKTVLVDKGFSSRTLKGLGF